MQKTCSRCHQAHPLSAFPRRALSADGHAAACRACINSDKQTKYWIDPAERQAAIARSTATKQARFEKDPAYKRAFNLWGSTKKRATKIPPWVSIADFVPVCRKALKKGPAYELDHAIPLAHPDVCGLHVPGNLQVMLKTKNRAKGNTYRTDWNT